MSDPLSKTPFAKLIIPAIGGILISSNNTHSAYPFVIGAVGILGIIIILISFATKLKNRYSYRWVSGMGIYIIIFAMFSFSTQQRNKMAQFDFENTPIHYIGTIASIPQEKAKSFACNINLNHPHKKKIVAYFEKNDSAIALQPGDEVIFFSTIGQIRNFGNPNDFNYERYMHNKGFAGSTYITASSWQKSGATSKDIKIKALRLRQKAISLYQNLDLKRDAYSFISAITLGHKHDLDNELKEAFQSSGTSHILAVSGLHVGIVYAAIVLILSLLGNNKKIRITKQILAIIILWLYAMITGLSPSIVRATIMITIVLIGRIANKDLFTYNVLAASAFLILAFNPQQLYDVSFQLSFAAVASIIAINPILIKAIKPKGRIGTYVTNIFTMSLSAQIGVLPITLYYFGTFPTYFFIANMIIIPIIPLVIYTSIPLIILAALSNMGISFITTLSSIVKWVLEVLIEAILGVVYWIESLPASQISELHISLLQTIISLITIVLIIRFINTKKASLLISSLCSVLVLLITFITPTLVSNKNYIVVYNSPNRTDISMLIDNKKRHINTPTNGYIPHSTKRILLLSENRLNNLKCDTKLDLDVLILSSDKSFRISQLNKLFTFEKLIIDSTTPLYIRNKWIEECDSLGIQTHDISQKGAFLINL